MISNDSYNNFLIAPPTPPTPGGLMFSGVGHKAPVAAAISHPIAIPRSYEVCGDHLSLLSPSIDSGGEDDEDMPTRRSHKRSASELDMLHRSLDNLFAPPNTDGSIRAEDVKQISELPVVRYIRSSVTPKACGKCTECKKPPCGVCGTCVLNKRASEGQFLVLSGKAVRDNRRCEVLCCKNQKSSSRPVIAQIPTMAPQYTIEELNAMITTKTTELTKISTLRGKPEFDQARVDTLLREIDQLRVNKTLMTSKGRRFQTPVGFQDVWSMISHLETKRAKCANFVVKAKSEECRTVPDKREICRTIDFLNTVICTKLHKNLVPAKDSKEFLAIAKTERF
jgi:hypothetical protein